MNIFPRLYDAVMGIAERGRVGRLRRAMVSKARGRVLEIGAGTGLDFPYYQTDAWVVASDPDLDMLRRGRPRAGAAAAEVLLVAADAELLPFVTEPSTRQSWASPCAPSRTRSVPSPSCAVR